MLRNSSPSRHLFLSVRRHLSRRSRRSTFKSIAIGSRVQNAAMTFLPPYKYMKGDDLASLMKSGAKAHTDYVVVDVRDDDRIGGHILNSVHLPSYLFEDQVANLVERTKDVPTVVFHCALSQQRGPKAARIYSEKRCELQKEEGSQKDFDVYVLRGGFTEFQLRHRNDANLIEAWNEEIWNNHYF